MRKQSPILTELQAADAILARAGRERPCGVRSSLSDRRGGIEPSVERVRWAINRARAVEWIQDTITRRVVAHAMATVGGEAAYSRRGIAEALGISEPTVTRKLKAGLLEVANRLAGGIRIYAEQEMQT